MKILDFGRKQMNDIGEVYDENDLVDLSEEVHVDVKKQRRKRLAILFAVIFVLVVVVALIVCTFFDGRVNLPRGIGKWGLFGIVVGVSSVLLLVPTFIMALMK